MSVGTAIVSVTSLNIVADNPIQYTFPLFDISEVEVTYGKAEYTAVLNADYDIALSSDNSYFTLTPTDALLAKIDALIVTDETETNYITVRRQQAPFTEVDEDNVRRAAFLRREIERLHMHVQELNEKLMRVIILGKSVVGADPNQIIIEQLVANKLLTVNADATKIVMDTSPAATSILAAAESAEDAATSAAEAAASAAEASEGLLDGTVTMAKLADLAEGLVVGRAAGAGAGVPLGLSAAQLCTILSISSFAKTILDDAAATNVLTTLGVSAFAKTILDDADAAAARATLGVSAPNDSTFRTVITAETSLAATQVAGTYMFMSNGVAKLVGSTTGDSIPTTGFVYIDPADFPTVDGKTTKLRLSCLVYTNDSAPVSSFTLGLYPVTRPGTSGSANAMIFTFGTVVAASNGAVFTTPAADGLFYETGYNFAIPTAGHYAVGLVSTDAIASNANVHFHAKLQMLNT